MRNRARLAVGGALLVVVPTAVVLASAPALAVDTPPPLVAEEVTGSITYLRTRYGVNDREALRRLDLQRINPAVNEALNKDYPDAFAGSHIDQERGGRLVVHATDTATVRRAVRRIRDAEHIDVVPARWSLKELQATANAIDSDLNPDDGKARVAEVSVDVEDNVVAVYQYSGAVQAAQGLSRGGEFDAAERAAPAVPDTRVAVKVSRVGGRAVHRQLVIGKPKMKHLSGLPAGLSSVPSCDPRYCRRPMRGGQRLDVKRNQATSGSNNSYWGQCTNGFNLIDNRGWSFVLTAGHCTVGTGKVGDTRTYSSYETGRTPIGYEVGNLENGPIGSDSTYPYDYAIQPYLTTSSTNYSAYWLSNVGPRNLVNSYCWTSSSTKPCSEGSFGIVGYYSFASISVGWVVCGSGSGDASSYSGYPTNVGYAPGTRCGQVVGKDAGIVTNLCMRSGDSGGPLFSEVDSKAYGILSWGTQNKGSCSTSNPGTERNYYSPLSRILGHAHNQSGYSFGLRTIA